MSQTHRREPKTRPNKIHAEVMTHIKNLSNEMPEGFVKGEVSPQYLDYLIDLFQRHGFKTEKDTYPSFSSTKEVIEVRVSGQNILALFGNAEASYSTTRERIAADNAKCFDKYSRCPLVIKLPLTIRREAELLEHLRVLGTKAGYEAAVGDWGGGKGIFPYEMPR